MPKFEYQNALLKKYLTEVYEIVHASKFMILSILLFTAIYTEQYSPLFTKNKMSSLCVMCPRITDWKFDLKISILLLLLLLVTLPASFDFEITAKSNETGTVS